MACVQRLGAMEVATACNLPKLPGFDVREPVPADEADFPKSQTLTWKNGYSVVHKVPGAAPTTTRQLPQAPAKLPAPLPAATQPPRLPKWVQFEHQTLRFSAFFEETVPNSPAEAWRVRRCHVLHFLGDGTTQVVEPKDGSGLPQGTLVLRRRVPRAGFPPKKAATASFLAASEEEDTPDERAFIGPADLGVGRCVCLHGRTFHLIDADAFTRDFMQAHGMPQPPALPCPASPIDTYKEQRSRPSGLTRTDPQSPSRFAEALLGRAPSTKRLQRFLEADRRVLRYWAVWDDPAGAGGQGAVRRPYSIAYHLEDDSVEVVELPQGNGGREFYHFLKRAPLPKVAGCAPLGQPLEEDQCVRPADLRVGRTLSVYGRQFFIHDADEFTRKWCMANLGCSEEELASVDVSVPVPQLVKPTTPPHNGLGDPEDALQNCLRLVPRPPKHDLTLLMRPDAERLVLRFAARLVEGAAPTARRLAASDRDRRFGLSYFLTDGTLSIFEPPVPNSGVVGGKFLQRGKVYKPGSTTERYGERDMFVGARLQLHGRVLELTDADDFTFTHMEADLGAFPMADAGAAQAAARWQAAAAGRPGDAQRVEAALHAAAAGKLAAEQLQQALLEADVQLVKHQAVAICRQGQQNEKNATVHATGGGEG